MFLLAHAQFPKSDCLVGTRRRNEENVHTKKITNNFWDRIDAGAAREEFGATIEIRRQLPKAINHFLSQFLNFFQPVSSLLLQSSPQLYLVRMSMFEQQKRAELDSMFDI